MSPRLLSQFNPEKLLDVTSILMGSSPSEPEIRTILNRCYYACYLSVKKKHNKIDATDKISHLGVYEHLQKHNVSELKTLFRMLNRCRVAADYGLQSYQDGIISTSIPCKQFPVDLELPQTGQKAIKIAKRFFKKYK